jgi:hypothetical protein
MNVGNWFAQGLALRMVSRLVADPAVEAFFALGVAGEARDVNFLF